MLIVYYNLCLSQSLRVFYTFLPMYWVHRKFTSSGLPNQTQFQNKHGSMCWNKTIPCQVLTLLTMIQQIVLLYILISILKIIKSNHNCWLCNKNDTSSFNVRSSGSLTSGGLCWTNRNSLSYKYVQTSWEPGNKAL